MKINLNFQKYQKGKIYAVYLRRKSLPAFALIDLAVAVMIFGLLLGFVLVGGNGLMDTAKIRALTEDIEKYRLAVLMYKDKYGFLPGDDPQAQDRFGDGVENGAGEGKLEGDSAQQFWIHLSKDQQVSSSQPPVTKFGALIEVTHNPDDTHKGNWFRIGAKTGDSNKGGFLTPKQAQELKSKAGEQGAPNEGLFHVVDGEGGGCLTDNKYKLDNKSPTCTLLIPVE